MHSVRNDWKNELLCFLDGLLDTVDEVRATGADVRSEHVTTVTLDLGQMENS